MSHRLQHRQRQQELPRSVSNFTKTPFMSLSLPKDADHLQGEKNILKVTLFSKKGIKFKEVFS